MNSHPSTTVAAMAAEWLAKHDRGLSPQETTEFLNWKNADPRNAQEWESMRAMWREADALELIPELATQAAALDERTRKTPARSKTGPAVWFAGLAAAAAVVIGLTFWKGRGSAQQNAPVAVTFVAAEARTLSLPDGSVVAVRGDSRVTHDFSGTERRVVLSAGEAFFLVAHDPSRPFIVEASGVVVRAVGTAFNVRRGNNGINLIVTEGRVQVATPAATAPEAPLVSAGNAMLIDERAAATATAHPLTPGEIEVELKWRSPQLEFSHASLANVIAAFGEHSAQRIKLGDPGLAQRTISGTFQADNIEGFLRLAELSFGLRVERGADGLVTLYPAR